MKDIAEKLDKFKKQRLQEIKVTGVVHPFVGMLFSSNRLEPVGPSFEQTKSQLAKLAKSLK